MRKNSENSDIMRKNIEPVSGQYPQITIFSTPSYCRMPLILQNGCWVHLVLADLSIIQSSGLRASLDLPSTRELHPQLQTIRDGPKHLIQTEARSLRPFDWAGARVQLSERAAFKFRIIHNAVISVSFSRICTLKVFLN